MDRKPISSGHAEQRQRKHCSIVLMLSLLSPSHSGVEAGSTYLDPSHAIDNSAGTAAAAHIRELCGKHVGVGCVGVAVLPPARIRYTDPSSFSLPSPLPLPSPASRKIKDFSGNTGLLQDVIKHILQTGRDNVTVDGIDGIFADHGCGGEGKEGTEGTEGTEGGAVATQKESSPVSVGSVVEAFYPVDESWRVGIVISEKKDWRGKTESYLVGYGERETDFRITLNNRKWHKGTWVSWSVEPGQVRAGDRILPAQSLWRDSFEKFVVRDGVFEMENLDEVLKEGNQKAGWGLSGVVLLRPDLDDLKEALKRKGDSAEGVGFCRFEGVCVCVWVCVWVGVSEEEGGSNDVLAWEVYEKRFGVPAWAVSVGIRRGYDGWQRVNESVCVCAHVFDSCMFVLCWNAHDIMWQQVAHPRD